MILQNPDKHNKMFPCSYLTYTILIVFQSRKMKHWRLEKFWGKPSFHFVFLKDGLKTLQIKTLNKKNVFFFILLKNSKFILQLGLWPQPTCCYVSHIAQNKQFIQSLCPFVFPSEGLYVSERQDSSRVFSLLHVSEGLSWVTALYGRFFDSPCSFDFIFIVAVKSLFCAFQAPLFFMP